jgi:chemotaxis-related protein WspD
MSRSLPVVEMPMEECWRRIGVAGDRSCPELETFIHCRNCPVLAEAARTFFDREAPEGYLEAWSQLLEEPEETVDPDSTSVLVFRLGREWLALPATALIEVTPLRPLHHVPHRTGGVLDGLVNIRGQLQLCVSLYSLLGLEGRAMFAPAAEADAAPTAARLLVIERGAAAGAERWVFGVDEVAGVHRALRAAMRAVPSTVSQAGVRHCQALFDWQGRAVGLLDETRVFDGLRDSVGG